MEEKKILTFEELIAGFAEIREQQKERAKKSEKEWEEIRRHIKDLRAY